MTTTVNSLYNMFKICTVFQKVGQGIMTECERKVIIIFLLVNDLKIRPAQFLQL